VTSSLVLAHLILAHAVLIEQHIELFLTFQVTLPFGFASAEFCAPRRGVLVTFGARDLLFVTFQIDDLAHYPGPALQREMNFKINIDRCDAGVAAQRCLDRLA
jgi:hypothetical protein